MSQFDSHYIGSIPGVVVHGVANVTPINASDIVYKDYGVYHLPYKVYRIDNFRSLDRILFKFWVNENSAKRCSYMLFFHVRRFFDYLYMLPYELAWGGGQSQHNFPPGGGALSCRITERNSATFKSYIDIPAVYDVPTSDMFRIFETSVYFFKGSAFNPGWNIIDFNSIKTAKYSSPYLYFCVISYYEYRNGDQQNVIETVCPNLEISTTNNFSDDGKPTCTDGGDDSGGGGGTSPPGGGSGNRGVLFYTGTTLVKRTYKDVR